MDEKATPSNEAPTPGGKTQSQQGLYAKFEPLADKAIEKLAILLESRNEAIALGAVKTVLERVVPAKKAIELTGENGEPIKFNFITPASYISAMGKLTSSSTGSAAYGSTAIQGADMAQASTQDNDSNKSDSSVEPA